MSGVQDFRLNNQIIMNFYIPKMYAQHLAYFQLNLSDAQNLLSGLNIQLKEFFHLQFDKSLFPNQIIYNFPIFQIKLMEKITEHYHHHKLNIVFHF